jgi:hypothetical protein
MYVDASYCVGHVTYFANEGNTSYVHFFLLYSVLVFKIDNGQPKFIPSFGNIFLYGEQHE